MEVGDTSIKLKNSARDLDSNIDKLRKQQNMKLAILGGLSAFLFCSVLWALLTRITDYQVGYMAIGIGLIVGFAVRYSGRGYHWKFGLIGAIYSVLSIIVGNLIMVAQYISHTENIPHFDVIITVYFEIILAIILSLFESIDILFYGIAMYVAFKISYRRSQYKI